MGGGETAMRAEPGVAAAGICVGRVSGIALSRVHVPPMRHARASI